MISTTFSGSVDREYTQTIAIGDMRWTKICSYNRQDKMINSYHQYNSPYIQVARKISSKLCHIPHRQSQLLSCHVF